MNASKDIHGDTYSVLRLLPLALKGHWRQAIVLFGIILFASIMEGLGFSLIIPFFQTAFSSDGPSASGGTLQRLLFQISEIFPADYRLAGLLVLVLLAFAIKSVSLTAASAVTRWFVDTLRMEWLVSVFLANIGAPYAIVAMRPPGEIVQNIVGETQLAARATLLMIEFSARLIQIAVLFVLLLLTSWQATLFIVLLIVAAFAISWRSTRLLSIDAGRTRQILRRQSAEIVSEAVGGLRTVKLLDIASARTDRLRHLMRKIRYVDTRFETTAALPTNMIDFIAIATGGAIILFMTAGFGMRLEDVLATAALFGIVFLRIASAAGFIFSKRLLLTTSLPPLQSVIEATGMESPPESGSVAFPGIQGPIVLEDIVMQPEGRSTVFDGLRMTIAPKGLTAIMGPSGSGKTTLVDLIVRLRDPDGGRVTINGRDVRDFEVQSLRARIGYVSQEPQLFNGTVAENLRMGRPDASESEMIQAATDAHAHEFISTMPAGYDTPLGRNAVTLSGGQRQRLALARELLRKPDLYIFDEPTSALDPAAETIITDLVKTLTKTHPVILISHRPEMVLEADAVYRLEDHRAVLVSRAEMGNNRSVEVS
jgi:subfamily B ATP-binding cassette protein MsbA